VKLLVTISVYGMPLSINVKNTHLSLILKKEYEKLETMPCIVLRKWRARENQKLGREKGGYLSPFDQSQVCPFHLASPLSPTMLCSLDTNIERKPMRFPSGHPPSLK
jgi:hypothetical protein